MASNPIQRKTRNAFLLGMVIMLVLIGVVAVILLTTVFKNVITDIKDDGEQTKAYAYKLIAPVKSGETISQEKIEKVELYSSDLPQDIINDPSIISYKSKVDLKPGTVLCNSILYKDNAISNSTRVMEYNMLTLPSRLAVGDYVDVRLSMPNGQDYIVLSDKQVMNIQNTTITLYLTENEILMMSSAIIESYIMKASNLYVVQYVEPGIQETAIPTYAVNNDVYNLIQSNRQKGISPEDYKNFIDNYDSNLRQTISSEVSQYETGGLNNIEQEMEAQKKEAMSLYLSGLSGY